MAETKRRIQEVFAAATSEREAQKPTKIRPGDGEILIAVMGTANSGKSHFWRAATGGDKNEIGAGPESRTLKPARHQLKLRTDDGEKLVTLLDTPGFDSSSHHDAVDLRDTHAQGRKFSGILYFHRISDFPVEGSAITDAQINVFHELCGDDSGMLRNVILVTNGWDLMESEGAGVRRWVEPENNHRYWSPMRLQHSQVTRFEGTTESALELIRLALHNTPLQPNKHPAKTGARRFVKAEIDNLRREHQRTLATIRKEVEIALQEKDEDIQILKRESERSGEELRKQIKADTEKVLALLSKEREERKLRQEELERMEKDIAQLKEKQLEMALQISNLQLEQGKATDNNEQAQIIGEQGRAIGQEPERPQIQLEQQPEGRVEDLENQQGDERGSRVARDGQASATIELSAAVRDRQDLGIIRTLLGKGANPALCIAQPGEVGVNSSALHLAAGVGCGDTIDIFIESGVTELDCLDGNGSTALIWAAGNGHTAVVNTLLEKGAKPDIKNKYGTTPILKAARYGHEEVVSLLLAKGAKLDCADNEGNTALITAAAYGHEVVVRLLLEKAAKLDIANNSGHTALSYAASYGYKEIVLLLRPTGPS